jgi:hypothetical protein
MEITGRSRFFTIAAIVGTVALGATVATILPTIFRDDSLLVLGVKIFVVMFMTLGFIVLLMDSGFLANYKAIQKLTQTRDKGSDLHAVNIKHPSKSSTYTPGA